MKDDVLYRSDLRLAGMSDEEIEEIEKAEQFDDEADHENVPVRGSAQAGPRRSAEASAAAHRPLDTFDKYTRRGWRGVAQPIRGWFFIFCIVGFAALGALSLNPIAVMAMALLGLLPCSAFQGSYLLRLALRARTDWGSGLRLALYLLALATVIPCVAAFLVYAARHGLRASVGKVAD
jgi:hypothetical protein